VKGPSYETASEVEMIRRIGGDAVGMSTVNESSLAVALGMRIVGVSCITNLATGILNVKLSHSEVTEVADRVKSTFSSFITGLVSLIDSQSS
jgi:purine-nucleoside phosphorylase